MVSRIINVRERRVTYEALEQVHRHFHQHVEGKKPLYSHFFANANGARWEYDTFEQLVRAARGENTGISCRVSWGKVGFRLTDESGGVELDVSASSSDEVLDLALKAEDFVRDSPRFAAEVKQPESAKVFVGHGRSSLWQSLLSHLRDQHGVVASAYETGARSGHTIRDILSEELDRANFAIIMMTAEDAQADGNSRARQNVIHEAGLFQGRLGFNRVAVLVEDGVENFSNIAGIQYIGFSKGNIRETFGDVLAMLRREFPGSD